MRHQLVGLLSSGIERYRIVHLIIRAVGYLLVGAVDRRGRSIDKMLYRMIRPHGCTAGFQNAIETDEVGLNVLYI